MDNVYGIYNAEVEVVDAGKPRVKPVNMDGFVRFPRALRTIGKRYIVELLKPGKSGSWIATGSITLA